MKRFVVFHNYFDEGWKIAAECDSVLEAVEAREEDVQNGGGVSEIFERLDLYDAYGTARYQREEIARKAAKESK